MHTVDCCLFFSIIIWLLIVIMCALCACGLVVSSSTTTILTSKKSVKVKLQLKITVVFQDVKLEESLVKFDFQIDIS